MKNTDKKTGKNSPKKKFRPMFIVPTLLALVIGWIYLHKVRECRKLAAQNLVLLVPSIQNGAALFQMYSNRNLSPDNKKLVDDFESERSNLSNFLDVHRSNSELKNFNALVAHYFEQGDRLLGLALLRQPPLVNKNELSEKQFQDIWRNDKANYSSLRDDLSACGVK